MRPYQSVVGENVKRLRDEAAITQEQLAHRMRLAGWNGATVAAIETGKRSVSLGEALLLTSALEPASLSDLLSAPASDRVDVEGVALSGRQLRRLVDGDPPANLLSTEPKKTGGHELDAGLLYEYAVTAEGLGVRETGPTDLARMALDALGDVENRAARSLGVSPFEVVAASYAVWGRTISEERDRRLLKSTGEQRRGQRGHVTRTLLAELGEVLREVPEGRRPGADS